MYDSSAKLPTGILNGNVNQLGDFDLCLQAEENHDKIYGKYCLASMQVEAGVSSPYILALHRLAQSHNHFRSQLDDVSDIDLYSLLHQFALFWFSKNLNICFGRISQ